jgi:hypothetical protein
MNHAVDFLLIASAVILALQIIKLEKKIHYLMHQRRIASRPNFDKPISFDIAQKAKNRRAVCDK